ncbi:MAG: flagellar biosynthesis protein FliQ [Rhodobacteraceae bacterium]|nr:flagellar biosynthesis protein FliQ [Paracoccaceae bacterium]
MDATTAYDMIRQTIMTTLWASAPVLLIALGVGLVIAFFQALTQIQEMTLTFVPKIAAIFLTVVLTLPFMFASLTVLSDAIFDFIVNGFG